MTSTQPQTPIARATGRREDRDGTAYVVFERTFAAPIADVVVGEHPLQGEAQPEAADDDAAWIFDRGESMRG